MTDSMQQTVAPQPAYTHLASYYDRLMDADYTQWVEYLQALWEQYGIIQPSILELGCGTGNITIPLAKRGYSIVGGDLSKSMLVQANYKADQAKLSIPFIELDMCQFQLNHQFDVVLCACDGLNYVTNEQGFRQAFQQIKMHTKDEGLFLFDLNSEYKLAELYGEESYADLFSDFGYYWDNIYDSTAEICDMQLTFFVPTESGLYQRVVETHRQKLWRPALVHDLLGELDWEILGYYGFLTWDEPDETTERWQFIAQKKRTSA